MWDADKCNFCGDCLTRCQYANYDKQEAVNQIKMLMRGDHAEVVDKCVTCCACHEYCPTGADPYDLILRVQEKYNAFPISPETLADFDMNLSIPSEVIKGDPDKPVLSLCVMERSLPPGAIEGQIFKGLSIARGGDYFCLIGYVHVGKESPIRRNAQRFIDNVAALGKEVIFLHDDCYAMVHAKVRDYGIKVPFKYMHILEYLRNYLRDNRSKVRPLGKKLAYQRPCASRYTPEKDIFVDEIFSLIGCERPQRKYERENALCCTGAYARVYPPLAGEFKAKNIDDAVQCGADALITLCPLCDRVLKRSSAERGLRKIYITDLCRMALGEITWPA